MQWIREIEGIEGMLNNDARLIYEHCGIDVLISLWENLPGLNLYISTKPLQELKKMYVRKFYNGSNAKELALKLDVSERFIYNALRDSGVKDDDEGLF